MDMNVLVEPSPTALPHLRRCQLPADELDVVVISHFHADHTFGWPFLLLEFIVGTRSRGDERPVFVVGPPGVEAYLDDMMRVGSVPNVQQAARSLLDVRYVEVDGAWQTAGPLRFRAVEVEHVPYLRCFGYLFDRDGRTVGYTGDLHPCAGLDELAREADVLVLECNGAHPPPPTHMDEAAVMALRERFPDTPFVLTHLGATVDASGIPNVIVPNDFQTLQV